MSQTKTTTFAMDRGDYERFREMIGDVSASQAIAEIVGRLVQGKSVTLAETLKAVRSSPRHRSRHGGRPAGRKDSYLRKRRGRTLPTSGT